MTTDRIRNRTKTVTRRLGWKNLKVGEVLNACVKCMGIKPGEKIERICRIRVVSVGQEFLRSITDYPSYDRIECELEGFPHLTGDEFIGMFCENMRCSPNDLVTRIQFEYVSADQEAK